jgi:hypothetical protein
MAGLLGGIIAANPQPAVRLQAGARFFGSEFPARASRSFSESG